MVKAVQGPRLDPWSGNYIHNAATKNLHAASKTWCRKKKARERN